MKNLIKNFIPAPKDDESYMREYEVLYCKRLRITIFIISLLSLLGYSLAYFSYKEHFINLSAILIVWQALTIPLLLISYNERIFLKYRIILKYILISLSIFALCAMAYITGGSASPYYAGFILAIIGPAQMLPYSLKEVMIEYCFIFLCYIIMALLPNNTPFDLNMFLNNLYFMILASIIGINGAYQLAKNRIIEFNQRYDLEEANRIKKEKCKRLEEALTQIKSLQVKVLQEEKMKTMGIVTASVIHEINSPLNYVGFYAAKLKIDLKGNPELQRKIDGVSEGVKRIERVGRDLQKFASGGNMIIELFSLYEIITSALIYASNKLNKIKVNKVVEENIYVAGYPGELLQLFLNLLINASDALNATDKQEKRIDIICSEKNKRVSVKVRDNGPGIEKEKINKLFTPFFTTKTSGKGMGLGLSICANIVKKHKGELKVESKEGEFTEFSFKLYASTKELEGVKETD
jgi:two-component system sensor histidine kinase PhcS